MTEPSPVSFRIDTATLMPAGNLRRLYRLFQPFVEKLSGIRALESLHNVGANAGGGVRGFCDAVLNQLGLSFNIDLDTLKTLVTRHQPLILMGNHPLGGPEALALCSALEQTCPGRYRLLANEVLEHIPSLRPVLLSVQPDWTAAGAAKNAAALRTAYRHLRSGGVLALFPAGRVSAPSLREPNLVVDLPWSEQPLRMAEKAGAALATFHVTGQCSRPFLSIPTSFPRLRALRLIREMTHPAVTTSQILLGPALPPSQFRRGGAIESTAQRMRARCYALPDALALPPTPPQNPAASTGHPSAERDLAAVCADVDTLKTKGALLLDASPLEVLFFQGKDAPALLTELGRQREITFRAAGQGVGNAIDLSPEDDYYHHLVIWDQQTQRLVGAYRVGLVDRILEEHGLDGLYLSHVFEIDPDFFTQTGPAMELSRSIVVPDFQKDPRALSLLWRGLGTLVRRDPRYSTAFGSVTISNAFRPASRAYLKTFLETYHADSPDLRRLIRERNPFQVNTRYHHEVVSAFAPDEIAALKLLIEELEREQRTVPPLIRYYLNLGAKFLGFHVEAAFNDALYCLLRVDLRQSDPRHLKRFVGTLPDGFTTAT